MLISKTVHIPTPEELAEMIANTPPEEPTPVEPTEQRLDDIEAALMELAAILGGAE